MMSLAKTKPKGAIVVETDEDLSAIHPDFNYERALEVVVAGRRVRRDR